MVQLRIESTWTIFVILAANMICYEVRKRWFIGNNIPNLLFDILLTLLCVCQKERGHVVRLLVKVLPVYNKQVYSYDFSEARQNYHKHCSVIIVIYFG